MPISSGDIFWGGLLPALLAAAFLALVWKFTENAASSWRTAVVVSFLAGLWALDAQSAGLVNAIAKSMRTTQAKDLLPLMVLLAMVPDAVAALSKRGAILSWIMRVGLCVFVPWRLLAGTRFLPTVAPPPAFDTGAWSTLEALFGIGGLAAMLLFSWWLVRAENAEIPKLRSGLAILAALGASMTISLSGSISYGQLMGVLVATLVGCAIGTWCFRVNRGPDAAAGPLVIAFGSVLILAHFIAKLTALHAALLLIAFVVAVGWFFPDKWWSAPLRCAVCLITTGVAVGMSVVAFTAA